MVDGEALTAVCKARLVIRELWSVGEDSFTVQVSCSMFHVEIKSPKHEP